MGPCLCLCRCFCYLVYLAIFYDDHLEDDDDDDAMNGENLDSVAVDDSDLVVAVHEGNCEGLWRRR